MPATEIPTDLLTPLGAYLTLYRGHAARRAEAFGRSRAASSPLEHPA